MAWKCFAMASVVTFFGLFVTFTPVIAMNDLTVICPANNKECQLLENLVLFEENNLSPGYISSPRKLTVINKNPKEECWLAMRASNINGSAVLSREITLSATETNYVWYAGSLSDLSLGDEKSMGVVAPKSQNDYQLTASLNQYLGNEYQGLTTGFDLDLNFTCQLPTPTPTPSLKMTKQETVPETTVLGISTENPACSERVPQPPILTTTVPGENSITLRWVESNDPLTYYLIAYGTDSKTYEYGNPNVGGPGTNEYVVNGLSANTTYYFAVRAGNGCAPGEFSNQLPGTPIGDKLDRGAAVGFQNNILGKNNQDTSIPKTAYSNQGKVLGADNSYNRLRLLIIPPTLVYLLASFYRKRDKTL